MQCKLNESLGKDFLLLFFVRRFICAYLIRNAVSTAANGIVTFVSVETMLLPHHIQTK
jgi:hypothetical protein